MTKASKRRSYMWVIGLFGGAIMMAALHNALISGLCLWSAIITMIVEAMKSSPKSAGQFVDTDDSHLDDDTQWHSKRDRDWQREEEYYQDGFDAEQREHEDHGEV